MNQSKRPLWKRSILANLQFFDVLDWLDEVGEDGDMYGYERGDSGYYNDFKELFDELSEGAYLLYEAMRECGEYDWRLQQDDDGENKLWDDIVVSSLGKILTVYGYDSAIYDYHAMLNRYEEDAAQEEARKRLSRMTKNDLIEAFSRVMQIMLLFWDLKAAHDCLTAVVDELDFRGAILVQKGDEIDKLYAEYTGHDPEEFDRRFDEITQSLPQRMWVE